MNLLTEGRTHVPDWRTDYMDDFIKTDGLRKSIAVAVEALKYHDFDCLVFRGVSGLLIGPSVALVLNKSMCVVRKPNESSHSTATVEGDAATKRYIVIDDFVSSGNTVRKVQEAMKDFAPEAHCLGVLEVEKLQRYDSHIFVFPNYHAKGVPVPLTQVSIDKRDWLGVGVRREWNL